MTDTTIFYILLAILVFGFVLDRLLDYLNHTSWQPVLPNELKAFYDEDKYAKAYEYHKAKYNVGIISDCLNFIIILAFFWVGGFGKLSIWLQQFIQDPILLALAFFGVLGFAGSIINLPFGLYNTFVIEEKFGFNRTTTRTYILDKIKGLVLSVVLGGAIGYAVFWIILQLGENFWIYAWVFFAILMLLVNLLYTSVFVPIFNKLTPLPDGPLRQKIEEYSRAVAFPLSNIYVMDGSKRSSKANAFFSGIGKTKKIILYDTLIEKHSEDEVLSVLAHEVGHFKKKHIIKGLLIGLVQTGFTLWLLSKFVFSPQLSLALGEISWQLHVNLLAFSILYEPISLILGLASNILSRKHEYEADAYAAQTADKTAFGNALVRLSTDTLSNLTPHPAYVFFHYSHPTVLQRLRALNM